MDHKPSSTKRAVDELTKKSHESPEKEMDDDWGWGNEENGGSLSHSPELKQKNLKGSAVNGSKPNFKEVKEEQIVVERYTVTAVPHDLFEEIKQLVAEGEALSQPKYVPWHFNRICINDNLAFKAYQFPPPVWGFSRYLFSR